MNKTAFLLVFIITGLSFTCTSNNNNNNMEKEIDKIIEVPNDEVVKNEQILEENKQYKISEAAVGSIDGVVIKVGGIYKKEDKYYVKVKYAEKWNKIYEGEKIKLDENTEVELVEINFAEEPNKGSIVFEKVKT